MIPAPGPKREQMPEEKAIRLFGVTEEETPHFRTLREMHPDQMVGHYLDVRREALKHTNDPLVVHLATYHGYPHADSPIVWDRFVSRLKLSKPQAREFSALLNSYHTIPKFSVTKSNWREIISDIYKKAAHDPRVFTVAAIDSLIQLRNPDVGSHHKREIAERVMNFYAPDAHLANQYSLSTALREEALKVLAPDLYLTTNKIIDKLLNDKNRIITEKEEIEQVLNNAGILAEVKSRSRKSVYSTLEKIWRKTNNNPNAVFSIERMLHYSRQTLEKHIRNLDDLQAFRIIVVDGKAPDGRDWYLHSRDALEAHFSQKYNYTNKNRYDLYPKKNGYQSIHDIIGRKSGKTPVELQIRSETMHNLAETLASHAGHKGVRGGATFTLLNEFHNAIPIEEQLRQGSWQRFLGGYLRRDRSTTRLLYYGEPHIFSKSATLMDIAATLHPKQVPFLMGIKVNGKPIKSWRAHVESGSDLEFQFHERIPQIRKGWLGWLGKDVTKDGKPINPESLLEKYLRQFKIIK